MEPSELQNVKGNSKNGRGGGTNPTLLLKSAAQPWHPKGSSGATASCPSQLRKNNLLNWNRDKMFRILLILLDSEAEGTLLKVIIVEGSVAGQGSQAVGK